MSKSQLKRLNIQNGWTMMDGVEPVYTQGIMNDGAVILKDGERMTVDEIIGTLNALNQAFYAAKEELSESAKITDVISVLLQPLGSAKQNHKDITWQEASKILREWDRARDLSL